VDQSNSQRRPLVSKEQRRGTANERAEKLIEIDAFIFVYPAVREVVLKATKNDIDRPVGGASGWFSPHR
jgi:hypothetical protein